MAIDPKNPTETLEFIDALLSGWELHGKVMEDGKINFSDIPHVVAAMPKLWKGFAGIDVVDDELLVVDEDGKAKIKAKIAEFVLADDEELEKLIEELVELILQITALAKKFSEYFKK